MYTRTTLATAAVVAAGVMLGGPVQLTAQAQPTKDAVTAAAVLAEGGGTEREVEGSIVATSEGTTQGNPTMKTEHTLPVTADNFIHAETDLYFGVTVKGGGFGKFYHYRELAPIDKQDFV